MCYIIFVIHGTTWLYIYCCHPSLFLPPFIISCFSPCLFCFIRSLHFFHVDPSSILIFSPLPTSHSPPPPPFPPPPLPVDFSIVVVWVDSISWLHLWYGVCGMIASSVLSRATAYVQMYLE